MLRLLLPLLLVQSIIASEGNGRAELPPLNLIPTQNNAQHSNIPPWPNIQGARIKSPSWTIINVAFNTSLSFLGFCALKMSINKFGQEIPRFEKNPYDRYKESSILACMGTLCYSIVAGQLLWHQRNNARSKKTQESS